MTDKEVKLRRTRVAEQEPEEEEKEVNGK